MLCNESNDQDEPRMSTGITETTCYFIAAALDWGKSVLTILFMPHIDPIRPGMMRKAKTSCGTTSKQNLCASQIRDWLF